MAANSASSTISSRTERSFQDALKAFEVRLSTRERDNFKFTTLTDLKQTIARIQESQATKREAMNLARLKGFLEGAGQIGKVVEVFANSSQYVAFVWGPMKFLLQTACNFADVFDTLLEAYEQIGEAMPLVEQYHAFFADNSAMEDALAKIYEDILEFHRRALRFFTLPTWHQVFKSIWKDFKTRFGYIIQDLERHKTLIEKQSNILQFQQYQTDRKRLFDELAQLERTHRKSQYTDILSWMWATESSLDHDDICLARQDFPGSGAWLLRNTTYSAWRHDTVPRVSTLWLHGIPGAGKTVLASTIIDDCKRDSNAQTAYFYCKYGDPQKTTCASIMMSLLSQILSHDHDLLPWIYDEYLVSGQSTLKSVDLCTRLLKTVLLNTKKAYLVVDGLDECESKDRKMLLSALGDIINVCDGQNPGQLRLILVSRDESDIHKNIIICSQIRIKPTDNEDDIGKFIKYWCDKIQRKFELPEGDKESIFQIVSLQVDGMFLFAKLVVKNLYDQVNIQRLREELSPHVFPKGIDQAYDRIIQRLSRKPPEEWSMSKIVLGWMTCARRPLRWHEIQGAFAVDPEENKVQYDERRLRIHIRDTCGSLVTQLAGDRLELVHSTARHFLTNNDLVRTSTTECNLTALCLQYLTFECFDSTLTASDHRDNLLDGSYAFQEYAAIHWSDHFTTTIQNGPEALALAISETANTCELGPALADFVARYQLSEANEDDGNKEPPKCDQFEEFDFFDDLQHVYSHIHKQKVRGVDALDKIDPKQLQEVLLANRTVLEDMASSTLGPESRARLETCYGTNWFKCPKAACFYFHEGFVDANSREQHRLRHERPFRCTYKECEAGYRLGFSAKKDLDKHTLVHHPQYGQTGTSFSRLRKAPTKTDAEKADAQSSNKNKDITAYRFPCDVCPKRFSRASILKDHMRTHTNVKPYQCGDCEQSFIRSSDLRRHSQTHSGGKKYVCKGTRAIPPKEWGCGKEFSRADSLASHWRRGAGKACYAPQREEVMLRKQWEKRLKEMKTNGSKLPIPQALLNQHPDYEEIDWRRLLGETVNESEDAESADAEEIQSMASSSAHDEPLET